MAILFGSQHIVPCRVQLIEEWVRREEVKQGKQPLTNLVTAVLVAGRKSIATELSKKYGETFITMLLFVSS